MTKTGTASRTSGNTSLRERADAARTKAKRLVRKDLSEHPSGETLPAGAAVEQAAQPFPSQNQSAQSPAEGLEEARHRDGADGGGETTEETAMGRHESFENATPVAERLLSGTMLGSLQEGGRSDRSSAAIDQHRMAYQAWDQASDVAGSLLATDPGYPAARSMQDEAGRREDAAFDALLSALPSTIPDLLAALEYIPLAIKLRDSEQSASDGVRALETVRDGLRRAAVGHQAPTKGDPIFPVIEEARRLWLAHDALFRAREDGSESRLELDAHSAMWAYVRGPLLETVPLTAEGCRALARFVVEYSADQGLPLYEGDGGEEPLFALIAQSPLLSSEEILCAEASDPAISTIEASRRAEAAVDVFDRGKQGMDYDERDREEEGRLSTEAFWARKAALSSVPTTRTGQFAVAQFVRRQMPLFELADGSPSDDMEVWSEFQNMILAALEAPVGTTPASSSVEDDRAWAKAQAAEVDLSRVDFLGLLNLYDAFERTSDRWHETLNAPVFGERHPIGYVELTRAGRIVDREQDRAAEIRCRIAAEIARRSPANDLERDQQLSVLVRYELLGNGDLRDPAIRARIAQAWGG